MTKRLIQRIIIMALGALVYTISLQAQIYQKLDEENNRLPKSYPIHAEERLWKKELEVRKYVKEHPEALQRKSLRKIAAYSIGAKKEWYADDLSPDDGPRYKVPSTCKAVGTNCYIFVEDASWGTRVTQAAVDSVKTYFDSKTPANPSKGIFEMDTAAFGNPPNVDGDPKIIILLLDIKDGYSGKEGYVAGYFFSFNEIDPETPGYSTSNFAEIFFIDVNPANLSNPDGLNDAISTLAHEFQHMIHFNYDYDETTFINEGCSTLAEVNCGFPIYSPSLYAREPNHYLLDWRRNDANVLNDYSRTARFFVYMRDQVGMSLFKNIVSSPFSGTDGIDAGLQAINSPLRFASILQNWFIANMLDDRSIDTKYGYIYPNLPKPTAKIYYNPNLALTTETVNNYAVQYISFKNGSQLKATFNVINPALVIKAIEIGPTSKRVLDVTSGVEFSEPLFGSTYSEVHFTVMNTNSGTPYSFTYQASGISRPIEMMYDFTEPVGILGLAANDTACVTFDAVQGGKLDSIRVALRRSSTIRGGIWKSTGVARPSPLGEPIATNLTATGLLTPTSNPYPVPWPNWVTIDVRSRNVNTNSPFAVAFIADGAYSLTDGTTYNYVMTTLSSTTRSYTYSSESTSGANWYTFVSSTDNTMLYNYLVRAYVSFPTTGVRQTVELSPLTFSLDQNYPNPFNPSTAIQFTLPARSFMTLKVYDMIGREVATLINGLTEAGTHKVTFDAANLPSGVYLYRIIADKFSETKKLLLIK